MAPFWDFWCWPKSQWEEAKAAIIWWINSRKDFLNLLMIIAWKASWIIFYRGCWEGGCVWESCFTEGDACSLQSHGMCVCAYWGTGWVGLICFCQNFVFGACRRERLRLIIRGVLGITACTVGLLGKKSWVVSLQLFLQLWFSSCSVLGLLFFLRTWTSAITQVHCGKGK